MADCEIYGPVKSGDTKTTEGGAFQTTFSNPIPGDQPTPFCAADQALDNLTGSEIGSISSATCGVCGLSTETKCLRKTLRRPRS